MLASGTHALTHLIHQATRMRVILLLHCPPRAHSLTHLAHGQLIMVGTHPLPYCYAMKRLCHCTQVPLESMPQQLLSVRGRWFYSVSFQYPTVSGVEPVVTNQTFWLESTDSCDMPQKQACGASEISNTPIPSATKSQYMQLLGA